MLIVTLLRSWLIGVKMVRGCLEPLGKRERGTPDV